jgi:hypothetical protein
MLPTLYFKGTIDITLPPPSCPSNGHCYRVTTPGIPHPGFGLIATIVYVGDFIFYNGVTWDMMSSTSMPITDKLQDLINKIGKEKALENLTMMEDIESLLEEHEQIRYHWEELLMLLKLTLPPKENE